MSYLEEKLKILHECLTPITDFGDQLDIAERLDSIYQFARNSNYNDVIKSFGNLCDVSKKVSNGFDSSYIEALTDFRDKILLTTFDLLKAGISISNHSDTVIINEGKRLTKIITDIHLDNQTLWKITSREFEEVIGEFFRKNNYIIELTKQTRDNGYDLIAIKNIDGFPLKFLIECKRNRVDRPVGIEIIRSFNDVLNSENANKGILITTSYFSKVVIEKQKQAPYLLDLRDRIDIINWANEYCNK